MTPEVRGELMRLLSALCDGRLDDAGHSRLEALLDTNPECRRQYLEYLDLHARLLVHPRFQSPADVPAPATAAATPYPARPPQPRGRRGPRLLSYLVVSATTVAATLLVQLSYWNPLTPDHGKGTPRPVEKNAPTLSGYVATLARMDACVFEDKGQRWRIGSRLPAGAIVLRKGVASIHFDSGSDLLVEGPAELRLDSPSAATVLRGKVVFRADETAAAFDLHTPSSTLADNGTEYAVAVGPEGEEIHVFDGEVQRTPKTRGDVVRPDQLRAGEARRYGTEPDAPGEPTTLDPERFVRRMADPGRDLADPAAGLLAYEGFDYLDTNEFYAGRANGGFGWKGPWKRGLARPLLEGDTNRNALNVKEGLSRPGSAIAAIGGSFDYTGFAKYWRRLETPVRLDTDGVYYLSFLFRREGPQGDPVNAVAVLLRTDTEFHTKQENPRSRLNIGVGGPNELFTHLQSVGSRTPVPLSNGTTYLLVAKIVAGRTDADQVFMRVYGPDEPIDPQEPGSWSVVGPPFQSDLVFDWLEVHINSRTRQTLDEIRLGTTWASVAAPWMSAPQPKKGEKPKQGQ
jgi:ferric-dicitrate binding protein FerR (iron transport regulator)